MSTSAGFLKARNKHTCEEDILNANPRVDHLLSAVEGQRLRQFTANFPASLTSFYGYEFSLGKSAEGADFLLCIHKPEVLLQWISGKRSTLETAADHFFNGLETVAKAWQDSVRSPVTNLWLEYDYSSICRGCFVPNLFIGPTRGTHPWEVISTVDEIFQQVNHPVPIEALRSLLHCFRILPQGSWISQVGSMVARQERGLRVFIQDIPKGSIPVFLMKMKYPGHLDSGLGYWLDVGNELAQKVELDLDLALVLGTKTGLEFYFHEMENALVFLQKLKERNLCTTEKYERIRDHLRSLSLHELGAYYHFFSHFKIGFDGNRTFVAKAYLGFVTADQMPNVYGTKPLKLTR